MTLRLGTRGSALAVAQSAQVADSLRALGHDVVLVRIRTGGDVERGSLTRLGSLGVFAAELRTALLEGRCDFAVHSLKDLPTAAVPGLVIASVPRRADARDALCARDALTLAGLPAGATVGTGSPRRVAQLRALRPDLRFVDVRGNVGTRLARVADGDLDAVVLAAAGLERLGLLAHITDVLDILPAPGQGALALECRADNPELVAVLAALEDPATREAVDAERAVLAALGGGCAAPIAAWGRDGELTAGVFAVDGSTGTRTTVPLGPGAGERAVEELMRSGAAQLTDLGASHPSRLHELHDDTSLWRGDAVLAGLRILLTQAEGPLADGIRAAGAEVVAQPMQRRVTLRAEAWPEEADWIAFTSAATLEVMAELGLSVPSGARVAAVGPRTAAAAEAAGLEVSLVPEGESSAAALGRAWPEGGGRVVIPGSALSSTVLEDALTAKGYAVEAVPLYTMEPLGELPGGLVGEWRDGLFDAVAVTSGSAGEAAGRLLGWRGATSVVAFGPPSAAALRLAGTDVAAVAATQDAEGLIHAIASLRRDEA